ISPLSPHRSFPISKVGVDGGGDGLGTGLPTGRVVGVAARPRQVGGVAQRHHVERVVVGDLAGAAEEGVVAVTAGAVEALLQQAAAVGQGRVPGVEDLEQVRVVGVGVGGVAGVEHV